MASMVVVVGVVVQVVVVLVDAAHMFGGSAATSLELRSH